MKKLSNEIKVGILVFAALILLTILIFGVGEIHIFERGHRYFVIFDSTAGLNVGAQVRVGGVKVGSVEKIDFIDFRGKRRVLVTIRVRKDMVLHEKDAFKITMIGFLGDNYVEIGPGPSDARVVPPGGTVVGAEVVGMEQLFKNVQDNLGSLRELLDKPTIDSFKKSVKNTEDITTDLAFILGESRTDITATLGHLRSSSERLDGMLARNEGNFDTTLTNLSVMSEDFRVTAANLRQISDDLQEGKGSAGKFLKDEQLYDNLLTTTDEAQGLIKDVRANPGRYLHLSIF